MTRGINPLLDPLDVLRYEEPRTVVQAADFLQLCGYPITPGRLEQLVRQRKLNGGRDGKISDKELLNLLKKPKQFLTELPPFEMATVDADMFTLREVLERCSSMRPQDLIEEVCRRAYFLRSKERMRYLLLPESWVRKYAGWAKVPMIEPKNPAAPLKATNVRKVPTVKETISEIAKDKPVIPPAPVTATPEAIPPAPKKQQEVATPLSVTCNGKRKCYTVPAAAQLLRDFEFEGATEGKLYYHIKKGEIKLIAHRPQMLIDEAEIERMIENPEPWLKRAPCPHIPPEGVLTGVMLAAKYNLMRPRVYEALNSKLIPATSMTPEGSERNIWYILEEVAESIMRHPDLWSFLKGEKIAIEKVIESLGTGFKIHSTKAEPREAEPSDTPEGIEVITAEPSSFVPGTPLGPPAPPVVPDEPTITLEEILLAVHSAKRLAAEYERLVTDGYTDEEIVQRLALMLL